MGVPCGRLGMGMAEVFPSMDRLSPPEANVWRKSWMRISSSPAALPTRCQDFCRATKSSRASAVTVIVPSASRMCQLTVYLSTRPAVLRDVFVQEPLGQLRYRGRQPLVFLFPVQVPAVGDHLAARALAFSKGNASQHPIWTRMVQPRRKIWATWCLSPFGQNRIPKP